MSSYRVASAWFAVLFGVLLATSLDVTAAETPKAKETLLVAFDGKGTALGWDIGVSRALVDRLDFRKVDRMIFTGSSSGSLFAAYYSCNGFHEGSVKEIEELARTHAANLVLDYSATTVKLLMGENPIQSRGTVERFVDLVLRDGACLPRHPMVIVAGNEEVLDNRTALPFTPRGGKTFDPGDHSVSAGGKTIGKSCTYFVDPTMFEALSAIPAEERLCDLRRVDTADEMKLAILASVSEPTYFASVPEPAPSKLVALAADPAKRVYNGGFAMISVVQDIKRVVPDAYSMATGRRLFGRLRDRVVRSWFLLGLNETTLRQDWWYDLRIEVSKEDWEIITAPRAPAAVQAQLGRVAAERCLETGCLGKFTIRPRYDYAVVAPRRPLEPLTKRGIRPVLKSAGQ